MEMLPVTPERKAQLDDYANRHGQDTAAALDEVLANYLEWERQDYKESVEAIRRGYEDVKAGRTAPLRNFSKSYARSMAFRVEVTEEAERDGKGILEWLAKQHAGETGLRWFQGLEKAIASLATFPMRCPLAPENAEFPFEVRHFLYGRRPHVYRVVFMVENETVYILHIWHGRRKPVAPQ